jgi:hypothetical protein
MHLQIPIGRILTCCVQKGRLSTLDKSRASPALQSEVIWTSAATALSHWVANGWMSFCKVRAVLAASN